MFGLGLPFLSYFRRQVGLRSDVPSPTGSLHAKVGVLGQPSPTVPDESTVMNYLYKLKQMSGIVYASSTLRKTFSTAVVNVSAADYYESRYRQSATANVCSFLVGFSGKIRITADIKNNELYGTNNSARYDKQAQYGPGMQITVNGSSAASGRMPIQRNYNWSTITLDANVKPGDVVTVQVFSGYYYYTSCGSTYYYYNGGSMQNPRVFFDYDDSGMLQLS